MRRVNSELVMGDLREILSVYVENRLHFLWKGEPGNPAAWMAKYLILFILLLDSGTRRGKNLGKGKEFGENKSDSPGK